MPNQAKINCIHLDDIFKKIFKLGANNRLMYRSAFTAHPDFPKTGSKIPLGLIVSYNKIFSGNIFPMTTFFWSTGPLSFQFVPIKCEIWLIIFVTFVQVLLASTFATFGFTFQDLLIQPFQKNLPNFPLFL